MAGHSEEFDDIIDAHEAVMFILEQDASAQMGIDTLTFIGLAPHIVDLTGKPDLETLVRDNTNGFDLPSIFLNGRYFADPFVLANAASTGNLARFLDSVNVRYDAQAVAEIAAANQ